MFSFMFKISQILELFLKLRILESVQRSPPQKQQTNMVCRKAQKTVKPEVDIALKGLLKILVYTNLWCLCSYIVSAELLLTKQIHVVAV
jgi:hypothetical protein